MQRKDYYAILGVARNARDGEIKIAYRRLALRNHPDTNRNDPEAEDRFKEINEAYDVLSHGEKRTQYDLGGDPLTGGSPFRHPAFDPFSGDPFEANFLSPFRCRGGGIARALRRRGPLSQRSGARPFSAPDPPNLHIHDLPLTSMEASEGAQRDIRLHTGRGTLVFTVSIPAGAKEGTLFPFKHPVADGQEIELLFRLKITG